MRTKRLYLAGALVGALALAVSGIAIAAEGDAVQKFNASVSPKKLPKADFKGTGINVETNTYWEGADGGEDTTRIPPKANQAKVWFPDNLAFDTSEARKCNEDIGTMSTDEARDACPKAEIGDGAAIAALLTPAGRVDVEGVVTAFNGPTSTAANRARRAAGNPTILLHVYIESLDTTSLLEGELKNARGKFGNRLDVEIPALQGGLGALRMFEVTVKHEDYVMGTCPRNDRDLDYKARFTYSDADPITVTDSQRCKPKK